MVILYGEVLDGEVLLPVVGERLVELSVLFVGDVVGRSGPDGLGDDRDPVSHEVGGVEAHTELPNHGDVGVSVESLHEGLGAGLGDGVEVVEHVGLGHDEDRPMRFDRCVHGVREHSWTGMLEWGASGQLTGRGRIRRRALARTS